jgi:signal transduction histidine kinase
MGAPGLGHVRRHRGHLWANPNPGRGATFQFTLPVDTTAF